MRRRSDLVGEVACAGEPADVRALRETWGGALCVSEASYTEAEARELAVVLQTGALPVELEQSEVQTVSATLGRESLRQGIVAGVVLLGGVGTAQWLVLRRYLDRAELWVPANAFAWLVGLAVALGRTAPPDTGAAPPSRVEVVIGSRDAGRAEESAGKAGKQRLLTARGGYLWHAKGRAAGGLTVGYVHAEGATSQTGPELGIPLFVGRETMTMRFEPTYVMSSGGPLWSYRLRMEGYAGGGRYVIGANVVQKSVRIGSEETDALAEWSKGFGAKGLAVTKVVGSGFDTGVAKVIAPSRMLNRLRKVNASTSSLSRREKMS